MVRSAIACFAANAVNASPCASATNGVSAIASVPVKMRARNRLRTSLRAMAQISGRISASKAGYPCND